MLALVAFAQLLISGMAMAVRLEKSKEVRVVEKLVPQIITVKSDPAEKALARGTPQAAPTPVLPPPLPPEQTPLPPARPLTTPAIADPVVERLVQEARTARIAGDMATAITKLDAAREKAPGEPNALYERGLVFEDMAAWDPRLADQAADAFQAVLALGTSGAGSLYEMAGAKLRDGIAMPVEMRGKLALGRPRIFKDDDYQGGERVVLTVPIQCAPGAELDTGEIGVEVHFFDSTSKDGIQPAATSLARLEKQWVSLPFDFSGGEELLRVTYVLPEQDEQQIHLFGKRKYYGQVVELSYKGELLDLQAFPQHLASRTGSSSPQMPQGDQMTPEFITEDMMFDPNLPALLPGKPGSAPPPGPLEPIPAIPPLPQR